MSNAANNNDNKNGKRNIVLPHKNNKYDKYDKYKYYDPLLCPPIARSSNLYPQQRATVSNVSKVINRINIEAEVDDLADLINIGKKVGTEFKLEPHIEYNIDLAMLKN